MSKKYETVAKQIVTLVGGEGNVVTLHHCQTRLRFKLVDSSLAKVDDICQLNEVLTVMEKGGMFQIVIGTDVADCYEEIIRLIGNRVKDNQSVSIPTPGKKKSFDEVMNFISGLFAPIVPALAGAGMVKAALALLVAFNLIDATSQTYIILNMIGHATFTFMPIILAYSAANKLGCNTIISIVIAGIMVHPTWSSLVDAGEAVRFVGVLPFYLVKYTSTVLPIILVVFAQSFIEKRLNKIVPGIIRLVLVPMIEFVVLAILAFSILGPIGDYVGIFITSIFTILADTAAWLELGLLALVYQLLTATGMHHGIAPIGSMSLASLGYDAIFGPACICANMGQGVSSFIVGLLSKNSKTKQVGVSVGITAILGTTEPCLYGFNIPKKYPFVAGSIGAMFGGIYAGLTHTRRFATGSPSIFAVSMYIGDNTMMYFYNICIAIAITAIVSAILTVIFYKKYGHGE